MQLILNSPRLLIIGGKLYAELGEQPEGFSVPVEKTEKVVIVDDTQPEKPVEKVEEKAEKPIEKKTEKTPAPKKEKAPVAKKATWADFGIGQMLNVKNTGHPSWVWEEQEFIATVVENRPALKAIVIAPQNLMYEGEPEGEIDLSYGDADKIELTEIVVE